MSLSTTLSNGLKRRKIERLRPLTLKDRDVTRIRAASDEAPREILEVRPWRGEGGVERSIDLLEHFHERRTKWAGLRNASVAHAYELWFDGDDLVPVFVPGTTATAAEIRSQLYEDYPNSMVNQRVEPLPSGLLGTGHALAGARFDVFRTPTFPIRHLNMDGFTANGEIRDPYKDILTSLTRDDDLRAIVQILFRPIRLGMLARWNMKRIAEDLRSENTPFLRSYPATDAEQDAADVIEQQLSEDFFSVEGRVLVASPDGDTGAVVERARDIGHKLRKYYSNDLEQGLYAEPVGGYTSMHRRAYRSFTGDLIRRTPDGKARAQMSASELSGLAHIPDEDVRNSAIGWNKVKPGRPVPNTLPRFPWEDHGLDPATLSIHEKQAWIMAHAGLDSPVFVGTGARDGVEVGIPVEELEKGAHSLHTGQTRRGKTTVNQEKARQQADRGKGVLLFDPKGDGDVDQYLRTHPGEPEDTVILTVGDNKDPEGYAPRLNFLQLPEGAEPGTKEFKQRLEPRISAVEQLVRLGGDTGDGEISFGARIKGLIRLIARGLADMDETMAPIDLVGVLRSELGRETFIENQDREDLLRDMAESELSALSDREIEPTMRRLQPFALNAIVQPIVSASESSFSLRETVAEGRTILVENRSTDTQAGLMVCTVLLILIWIIKRELEQDTDEPDPPGWEIILDEAQDIASEFSGLPQILAQAAGFDVHVTISAQDLTSQIDDELADRILGETDKIVTFSAGRKDEARELATKHSEDIEWTDISRLPKYRAYFSVLDEDGVPVSSVQTATFAPLDEILAGTDEPSPEDEQRAKERAAEYGLTYRTSEEVAEFRHASNKIHGAREETVREIKERSPFFQASSDDLDEDGDTDDLIYKAVYDSTLAAAGVEGERTPVPFDVIEPRLRTYLGLSPDASERKLAGVFERYIEPEGHVLTPGDGTGSDGDEHEHDERVFDVAPEGIRGLRASGESENSGVSEHREVLRDGYDLMARIGAIPQVHDQDGTELPDGLANMPPGFALSETDRPLRHSKEAEALADEYPIVHALTWGTGSPLALESETQTVRTKGERTATNGRKAAESERIAVFLVADRTADSDTLPTAHDATRVEKHLTERTDLSRDQWHAIVLPSPGGILETPQVYLSESDGPLGAELVSLSGLSIEDIEPLVTGDPVLDVADVDLSDL